MLLEGISIFHFLSSDLFVVLKHFHGESRFRFRTGSEKAGLEEVKNNTWLDGQTT